jgi:hypothetical protein
MRIPGIMVLGIALTLFCYVVPVNADPSSCASIASDTDRLKCFDAVSQAAKATVAPADPKPLEDPLISGAKTAVRKQLRDSSSGKFTELRIASDNSGVKGVCGEINAKNAFGGYSGPQSFTYDGKFAKIIVADGGQGNPTSFGADIIGLTLHGALEAHDRFCNPKTKKNWGSIDTLVIDSTVKGGSR